MYEEKEIKEMNPWLMVALEIALVGLAVWVLVQAIGMGEDHRLFPWYLGAFMGLSIGWGILMNGFYMINPNQAKVFTLFGRYAGTSREAGFHYANPFLTRKKLSLRLRNLNSQALKVNDAAGNPIEIGAVVVWSVVDSAKALFDVEDYESFVGIQCETAIRSLASHFPYDVAEDDTPSLRGRPDEVAAYLLKQVQDRLDIAGVQVREARISHLAYAPEIAHVMLRRQQAEAVIAARRKIVDGAVGMVEMALNQLEKQGIVHLDDERKASMVNNLLVALVSDSDAQPVINTGSLYT